MTETERGNGQAGPDDGRAAERTIEDQIGELRGDLTDIVSELDRRRHEAFDLRLQVRRHARALEIVGAGAAFAIAVFAAWSYSRARRDTPVARIQNLGRALVAVSKHPDRLVRLVEGRPEIRAALIAALGRVAGTAGQRAIARM